VRCEEPGLRRGGVVVKDGKCSGDGVAWEEAVTYDIVEFRDGSFRPAQVTAIQEVPLTIYLNGQEMVTLLCTGKHPTYLAVGFLRSEGWIRDLGDLKDVRIEADDQRIKAFVEVSTDPLKAQPVRRSVTSGCGKGTSFDRNVETAIGVRVSARLVVAPDQIFRLMAELTERSTLYRRTRGCHNASLAEPSRIVIFREDIGRHNAIDMICGQCLLDGVTTEDKLIVTTGRIASEILLKTIRLGVPILVSGSAATRFSIDLARKTNMAMVGLVESGRMVVYNSGGRIAGCE